VYVVTTVEFCGLLVAVKMMSVVVDCLVQCRSAVRSFIHSSNCQKAVLAAILANTLSMGVEHHEQVRRPYTLVIEPASSVERL